MHLLLNASNTLPLDPDALNIQSFTPQTRVTFLCSGKASFSAAVTAVTAVRLAMCGISELQASQPVFAGFISSLSAVHFSRYNISWCQRSSSSSAEAPGLRIIWLHNLLSLSYKKILPTWLGYWQTELVCWGYYNQRPPSAWVKWQKFFSQFCSLEVQGQYVSGSGFF